MESNRKNPEHANSATFRFEGPNGQLSIISVTLPEGVERREVEFDHLGNLIIDAYSEWVTELAEADKAEEPIQ